MSSNGVIGRGGDLPWHLPADLRHFKRTTMGHHLIIGRRTWLEVGKPLPGRTMVVVTRNRDFIAEGALVVHTIEAALEAASSDNEPFIGGGSQIYRAALTLDLTDRMYITRVHAEIEGDTFFPEVDFDQWLKASEDHHGPDDRNEYPYTFEVWDRRR